MIATRIKELCEDRGISIAEVERSVGLGNGVIRRWDEGNPRIDGLKLVADYLGVTVDALLETEAKHAKN